MEPWPIVAWVLMLTFITDWLQTVQSRDFTEKDIIFLHPSTTPYPGGFKCFTCEEAVDNYECNRWAPDLYCPQESKYCYTRHKVAWGGNTVSVTKRCVALEDCLFATGCTGLDHEGNKVCVSCCEGNICNLPLPWNETDSIFATTSPLNDGQRTPLHPTVALFFSVSTLIILSHA
ncbi:ly6/PLAUR domain-containing protein 6 [Pygocentrus nattereri]|uniref:LY6/PLAUR domain containing 6 n=1 Tax=Pygocentrus nattereri TaxID=42514 RepID=A0AAR2LQ92_PYGNA|nr:ly6/PLAUR domain-containing protein 6 [Pygocentrus nattereri]XP_037395061.1 ly6/PLAUR domain-containing protein 6 [Pygocentrus nattereri]